MSELFVDNSFLFFKVWKNIVIKSIILELCQEHKRIYELVLYACKRDFVFRPQTLQSYKYRDYLVEIKLSNKSHLYDVFNRDQSIIALNLPWLDGDVDYLNLQIQAGTIPSNVKKVILNSNFEITKDSIPLNVTSLNLIGYRNQIVNPTWIGNNITQLDLGNNYSYKLQAGNLPMNGNLKVLKLSMFNHTLQANVLPETLEELNLCFGNGFNGGFKIGSIPNNIKKLTFNNGFNKSLVYDKESILSKASSQQSMLPSALEILEFENDSLFNQKLKVDHFSQLRNLVSIVFGPSFNQVIADSTLPNSLEVLRFGRCYSHQLPTLPTNLKELEFSPDSVFNHPIDFDNPLPTGLKSLKFGDLFDQKINRVLPTELTTLSTGNSFNQPIEAFIHAESKLKEIVFGDLFNQSVSNTLVKLKNIKTVIFGKSFNANLDLSLFKQIKIKFTDSQGFKQSNIPIAAITYIHLFEFYNNKPYERPNTIYIH